MSYRVSFSFPRLVPLAGMAVSLALLVILEAPWTADFDLLAPPGDDATFVRFVEVWVWWASALHVVVCSMLGATWGWWVAEPGGFPKAARERFPRPPAFQWLLLGVAISVAAYSGWPRLFQSLWGDELIAFRESVAGHFFHDVEGDGLEAAMNRVYWSEAGWADALWQYETPNPHFLYNLAGKLTLTLSQKSGGDQSWVVRESALRLLPFLAGLGALGAWFLLAWHFGTGKAAGYFCLALSFHPWFVRYITEARGYAFVFLFLPLVLMALYRAVRDPRWRNWTAYGILGGALVYSWPGMVVPWVCVNAAALVGQRLARDRTGAIPARRLVLTNVVLAMILLTAVAPCFAQLGPYLREDAARLPLGGPWLRDLGARMLLGIDWHDHGAYSKVAPQFITFESMGRTPALATALAVVGVAAIAGFVAGARQFFRRGGISRWLGVGVASSAPILYGSAALSGIYLFPWYFVYLLPGALLVVVAGLVSFSGSARWSRIPVALAFGGFALLSSLGTAELRARSADPRRESALATRGTLDPTAPENSRILTAHIGTTALGYDCLGWHLEEASEPGLPTLMRMADILERELLVNVGYPSAARAQAPGIMDIIDKSGYFERTHVFHGLEPQFEREIYRYRGGMFGSLRKKTME